MSKEEREWWNEYKQSLSYCHINCMLCGERLYVDRMPGGSTGKVHLRCTCGRRTIVTREDLSKYERL